MYRRVRVLVPLSQILAVIGFFAFKSALKGRIYDIVQHGLMVLAKQVNYPVWVVFHPMMDIVYQSRYYLPTTLVKVLAILGSALLPIGVFLLWYAAITEIEMRSSGRSVLRFHARWKTALSISILLIFGAGAFIKAYSLGSSVIYGTLRYLLYFPHLARWDDVVGIAILVAWGVVLTVVALSELRSLLNAPSG